jgi:hypothetical protein
MSYRPSEPDGGSGGAEGVMDGPSPRRVKRRRIAGAVAAALLAAAVGRASGLTGAGGRAAPGIVATVAVGGMPLRAATGAPLTAWVRRSVAVVVPEWVPPGARRVTRAVFGWPPDTTSRGVMRWAPATVLHGWAYPGVLDATVPILAPRPPLSRVLWQLLEQPFRGTRTAITVTIRGTGPGSVTIRGRAPAGHPVRTTLRAPWIAALTRTLPPGASLAALDGDGHLLAWAANRANPALIRWAQPVGITLLPPLLAVALDDPAAWDRGRSVHLSLPALAARWGRVNILAGYRALGVAEPPWPGVETAPLPTRLGPDALIHGQGVVASALAVARAWLPFVAGGHLPAVTVTTSPRMVAEDPKAAPLVASPESLQAVLAVLPVVRAGRWDVTTFDPPPYRVAVAIFRAGPTVRVVAVEGLPNAGAWSALLVLWAQILGR